MVCIILKNYNVLCLCLSGASVNTVDIRGRSPVQLAQSKLRILQQSQNEFVKSKVTQVRNLLQNISQRLRFHLLKCSLDAF